MVTKRLTPRVFPNSTVDTTVAKNVFYTILAHADNGGIAAGLTLQELCDFSGASTTATVKQALVALEASGAIRIEQVGRNARVFRVMDATEEERVAARMFQQGALERVNTLRAKRADLSRAERRNSASVDVDRLPVMFLNLVRLTKEQNDEVNRKKYRCDIHIGSIGTVRNCLIIAVPDKLLLYGPGRPIVPGGAFRDWFEFEHSFKGVILSAFASRLASSEDIPEAS
jgi:hypothetical protein